MKIKKIYIQNFKWIKEKKIIDLDKDITFLTWPNGFWKTTIFDVIELCLTWELYRVTEEESSSKVIHRWTNTWKAFYQNIDDKVLLKVLIKLDDWSFKNVIAYDSNNVLVGKRKPATLYFKFYLEDYKDSEDFENKHIDFNNEISLDNINELLWLKKNSDIKNNYKLFNYLQQEETTFFLKKSEDKRKKELDFLFNTENENKNNKKITKFHENLNHHIVDKLKSEIDKRKKDINEQKERIKKKEKIEYKNFFNKNDNINTNIIEFDNKELFSSKIEQNEEYKSIYMKNLNNIKVFLSNFSIEDYSKKIKKDSILKIRDDENFIEYFLLQKFNEDGKYRDLEKYNKVYNLVSQDDYYLESLIYDKFLRNDKLLELETKNILYNFVNNEKNESNLEAFILQNQLNDKKLLDELELKNNLVKYIKKGSNILDQFLLKKFDDDRIKVEYDFYKDIISDENNMLLKWFLLKGYFIKDESNNESKYELLEKESSIYTLLQKYKELPKNEKIDWFSLTYETLKLDNIGLLNDFKANIKRKKELEQDLKWNERIISELNELRIDLMNLFVKNNKINDFDNSCILCWTKEVNKEKISNFEKFKEFVEIKTDSIKKLSNWKTNEIDKINEKINEIIFDLEAEVELFLGNKFKKRKIEEFNSIKKYLTQNEFENNFERINKLIEDNKTFEHQELNFQLLDFQVEKLRKDFKSKYIDWFNVYDFYGEIVYLDEPFLDKSILKNFLEENKIDFSIPKKDFNVIAYQKIKKNIVDFLNTYLEWFDEAFYIILNNYANWNHSKTYKENIKIINNFFENNEEKEKFLLNKPFVLEENILEFNSIRENLKKYILDKTSISSKLHNKLISIIDYGKIIDKNDFDLFKEKIVGIIVDFKLNNIEDYNKDFSEKVLKISKEKIYESFKNNISVYRKVSELRKNIDEIKYWSYRSLLKKYNISEINKYILNWDNAYHNFSNFKEKLLEELTNKSLNTIYDKAKLWWGFYNFFNEVFNNDINLIEKYQKNKLELDDKKRYVEYKYFEIENNLLKEKEDEFVILEKRLEKLNRHKVKKLKDIYASKVNTYKREMIEWIQRPFYIYTAKILQNFQQWMWIFIVFEWDKSIRFYADWSSNHDAMHHLSSGQLAVVSIAFTLAVNKVYRVSEELNFLNIDDPVQEMDSLNIHSFIELIRHNFMDYKFIMSTHSDENAYFMKYKLEKIKKNSVQMINVQNKFFGVKN